MKKSIKCGDYDTLIQSTDWRYSAAIVGLVYYLDFHNLDYTFLYDSEEKPDDYIKGFDGIMYHSEDITKDRYLQFVESYFSDDMTHCSMEKIIKNGVYNDDNIKQVNDNISKKTVLKKAFNKTRFDGKNGNNILEIIEEHRLEFIQDIFRYGSNLYSNYCNKNLLFSDENPHCRLVGYTVDEGRKTRFIGFCFSKDSFIGNDIPEFDFIPFAFSVASMFETYFINNNSNINSLVATNKHLSEKLSSYDGKDFKNRLFKFLKEKKTNQFIKSDVEIICKNRDEDFYKTMYVRNSNLEALQDLSDKSLSFKYELYSGYWLNLENEVCQHCLNNLVLDDLIELMLNIYSKESSSKNKKAVSLRLIRQNIRVLTEINQLWKGNDAMDKTLLKSAEYCGKNVSKELMGAGKGNKIDSFRQKISSAITAHDYDRVSEILMNLSSYTGIEFKFFYTYLENEEENKNLVFAFVNALCNPNDEKLKDNNIQKGE